MLENIFMWDKKTNRTGTKGELGTGFGLPLAKCCVELIGGEIKVESITKDTPDTVSGSKFILQFDKVA